MNDMELFYEVGKIAAQGDCRSSTYWNYRRDYNEDRLPVGDPQMVVYAECSDMFFWGCGDAEQITPENLPTLKQAILDVREITGDNSNDDDAFLLFVARERKERPQGAAYTYIEVHDDWEKTKQLQELFNEAGPYREPGMGNPCEINTYQNGPRCMPEEERERLKKAAEKNESIGKIVMSKSNDDD